MKEQTKLTIRVPKSTLEAAKAHARAHGTTLTRMVVLYLERLTAGEATDFLAQAPTVRRLIGSLPSAASPAEHRAYLEKKYGTSEAAFGDRPERGA